MDNPVVQQRRDAQHSYDDCDLKNALSIIASQAESLRTFLVDAQVTALSSNGCASRSANDFVMAQQVVEYIGAIADQMIGGRLVGGAASWASMQEIMPVEVHHG